MEEKEKESPSNLRKKLAAWRLGVSWACFLLSSLFLFGHYLAVESFQSDVAYDGFFIASTVLTILLTLFLLSTFLKKEKSTFVAILETLLQVLITAGVSAAAYFTLMAIPSFVQAFLREDVLLLAFCVFDFLNALIATAEEMGSSLFASRFKKDERK